MSRLQFVQPTLDRLQKEEEKARSELGENYTFRTVSNRFNNRVIQRYNQDREYGSTITNENAKIGFGNLRIPRAPVTLWPMIDISEDLSKESIEDVTGQLDSGDALLRFNAHHENLSPADLDLEDISEALEAYEDSNPRKTKENIIDYYRKRTEVINENSGVEDFEPFDSRQVVVPFELNESGLYNEFMRSLEELIDPMDFDLRTVYIRKKEEAATVDELYDGLRAFRDDRNSIEFICSYELENGRSEPFVFSIQNGKSYDDPDGVIIDTMDYEDRAGDILDWLSSYADGMEWRFNREPA